MIKQLILPTAFFPNLAYFSLLINEEVKCIEIHEHFVKQTIRNRCIIASPQGPLSLSIPLVHTGNKTTTGDKLISYHEPWQIKHWRAIESAYRNSPYFEYFEEEIKTAFFTKSESLVNYNKILLDSILNILRYPIKTHFTSNYESEYQFDFRDEKKINARISQFPSYYQVFRQSIGFIPNLSILDLVFNEGLFTLEYLKNVQVSV
jgi:hypothetical protein